MTKDEINEFRVGFKNLISAMVEMARANGEPLIDIMRVMRDAPASIDGLCDMATQGLKVSGLQMALSASDASLNQYIEKTKAAEAELRAIKSRPEGVAWVSVSDRLPNVDELVIAFTDKYGCLLADRTTSNPDHGWSCDGKVTHWMRIPMPPPMNSSRD